MAEGLLFNKDLVFFDVEADSNLDALEKVATKLYEKGLVKESYINAIQEREKVFATGLPVEGRAVAIPHTDIDHVLTQAICVATLTKPVTFNVLAGAGEQCEVTILFMLAIKEPHAQLEMLQTVIGIIQKKAMLDTIYTCHDADKVVELVEEELKRIAEENAE